MKKQSAIAFGVGVGSGLLFLLVFSACVNVPERWYPVLPHGIHGVITFCQDPTPLLLRAGIAAVISGLLCGSGSALILRLIVGGTGPIRVKPIALMSLAWIVIPILAFCTAATVIQSPRLDVLVVPAASGLCGLAMIACTKLYVAW